MSWSAARPRTKAQRLHWESVLTGARGRKIGGRPRKSKATITLAPVEFGRGKRDNQAQADGGKRANVGGVSDGK